MCMRMWWTPGDGLWEKLRLNQGSPLVINCRDAMNDVELKVAQPLLVLWTSVQTSRLGVQCGFRQPSRSKLTSACHSLPLNQSPQAGLLRHEPSGRDLLGASATPTSLAILSCQAVGQLGIDKFQSQPLGTICPIKCARGRDIANPPASTEQRISERRPSKYQDRPFF